MRSTLQCVVVTLMLVLLSIDVRANASYDAKQIGQIFPPDGRGCLFFTLKGVSVVDPSVAANPWIAVPTTYEGYKELYALLLSGRLAGDTFNVTTSGSACGGYAQLLVAYTTD